MLPGLGKPKEAGAGAQMLPVAEVSTEGWERVVRFSLDFAPSRQIWQWEFLFDTVQFNSEIDPRTFRIF